MTAQTAEPGFRHEVKMVAPEPYAPGLRALLRLHPEAFSQLYSPRWVNNVYLDSQGLRALNQNYAGISDRCKTRFRWYGDMISTIREGTLELKLKRASLGWKKRYTIDAAIDLDHITWRQFLLVLGRNVPASSLLGIHSLNRPVLINRYHREYYATPDREIRLTVDTRQQFLSQWNTARPNLRFFSPPITTLVVEIKAPAAAEPRIVEILNRLPLSRSKNSKYVSGAESLIGLS